MSRLCGIVIPVYQNWQFLPDLLHQIRDVQPLCLPWQFSVVVVDDGSNPPVPSPSVPGLSITLLRHPDNQGKGAALKTGFRHFMSGSPVEVILTLDADLQHPPQAIPQFLAVYRRQRADLVYGHRPRQLGCMPWHRIVSNHLTSLIVSLLTGRVCYDSQCGFRLYKKAALMGMPMVEDRFHLESELVLRLGWRKARFARVPIPTIYNAAPSAIRNLPDTFNFVNLVVKLLFQRMMGNV